MLSSNLRTCCCSRRICPKQRTRKQNQAIKSDLQPPSLAFLKGEDRNIEGAPGDKSLYKSVTIFFSGGVGNSKSSGKATIETIEKKATSKSTKTTPRTTENKTKRKSINWEPSPTLSFAVACGCLSFAVASGFRGCSQLRVNESSLYPKLTSGWLLFVKKKQKWSKTMHTWLLVIIPFVF